MPKLPGISYLKAVRALEKAGFRIVREGKHTVMSDGARILTIPRHNPINAYTMAGIVRDAGLALDRFKDFLSVDQPAMPVKLRRSARRAFQSTLLTSPKFLANRRAPVDLRGPVLWCHL